MSRVRITWEGQAIEWDGRLLVSEEDIVFRQTGMHLIEWLTAVDAGSGKAIRALIYIVRKRQLLPFDPAADYDMAELLGAIEVIPDKADADPKRGAAEPESTSASTAPASSSPPSTDSPSPSTAE